MQEYKKSIGVVVVLYFCMLVGMPANCQCRFETIYNFSAFWRIQCSLWGSAGTHDPEIHTIKFGWGLV